MSIFQGTDFFAKPQYDLSRVSFGFGYPIEKQIILASAVVIIVRAGIYVKQSGTGQIARAIKDNLVKIALVVGSIFLVTGTLRGIVGPRTVDQAVVTLLFKPAYIAAELAGLAILAQYATQKFFANTSTPNA